MIGDHLLDHAGVVLLALGSRFAVLRGDHDLGGADRLAVDIAHSDLALGVGLQVGQLARTAGLAQHLEDLVREIDRGRHERALLVFLAVAAGEAEHQALVARAFLLAEIAALLLGVDAHGDVGRLAVQQNLDVGAVETEAVLVVADVAHDIARDLGQRLAVDDRVLAVLVHVGRRGAAFAGNDDLVGGGQRLAAQPRVGMAVVGMAKLHVIGNEGVENGVRDLVADLVRMTFGNRFAGENIVLERQAALPQITLDSGQGGGAANVRLSLFCRGGKSSKSVRGGIDHRGRAAKNSRCVGKSRASIHPRCTLFVTKVR